jgi:hypothetical protein
VWAVQNCCYEVLHKLVGDFEAITFHNAVSANFRSAHSPFWRDQQNTPSRDAFDFAKACIKTQLQ